MSEREIDGYQLNFLDLLGLLFIGLKLAGSIDWSWWWVLAPLWVPAGLVIVVALIARAVREGD